MNSEDSSKNKSQRHALNLALASVAGLVGFLTLAIILAAVLGGLWLDNQFGTKPLYTLILVIVSMPITLVLMFVIVRSITKKIVKNAPINGTKSQQKEEDHFE